MIECEIIGLIPEAQYQGTTYSQTAICRLTNGKEIPVFDSTVPLLDHEMVGSQLNLELLAYVKDYEIGSIDEKGIISMGDDTLEYRGEIISTDANENESRETFCIDVGVGTIHVSKSDVDEDTKVRFDTGKEVTLQTYRTDLVDYH